MIRRIFAVYSARSRRRRRELLDRHIALGAGSSVLDLGGGNGSYADSFADRGWRITVADIGEADLAEARRRGYETVLLSPGEPLPFSDREFDMVFCNSVIEHVGGTALGEDRMLSDGGFVEAARREQRRFAEEIRRVGKSYWVQTPNRFFIVESHTWLPLVGLLPRRAQLRLVSMTNAFWVKKTSPDWVLFTRGELAELLPGSLILDERSLGMTKSLIAFSPGETASA
jgi:SAM-dependent methyltransferase